MHQPGEKRVLVNVKPGYSPAEREAVHKRWGISALPASASDAAGRCRRRHLSSKGDVKGHFATRLSSGSA